jgi:hypothetical protein
MLKQRRSYPVFALSIAGLLLSGLSHVTLAQSQEGSGTSVAEAARRAREKKKNATKPVRTLTNDDLPEAPAVSSQGNREANPASTDEPGATATRDAGRAPETPASGEQAKQKKAENAAALERAKKELAQAEKELDVMQRKAALDSDTYYSKPDFASDKEGKANLDAEAQQISDKKQSVEMLKARVAELQALVGEPASAEPDKNPSPR